MDKQSSRNELIHFTEIPMEENYFSFQLFWFLNGLQELIELKKKRYHSTTFDTDLIQTFPAYYYCSSDLRLQLLDPKRHSALVEALYGLLMLLPQTKAFTLLHDRLNCLPPAHLLQ